MKHAYIVSMETVSSGTLEAMGQIVERSGLRLTLIPKMNLIRNNHIRKLIPIAMSSESECESDSDCEWERLREHVRRAKAILGSVQNYRAIETFQRDYAY